MTPAGFRRIALSLPDAAEGVHMKHPDFRVRGKIFATLGYPDGAWGMVKLTPEDQALYSETRPATFKPVPGGWGRGGSTLVRLSRVDSRSLRSALTAAWRRTAPKTLAKRLSNFAAGGET